MSPQIIADALMALGEGHQLIEQINSLRTEVEKTIFRLQFSGASDTSQMIRCPNGDTGIYAREDGITELFAGFTRVILDKENESILINSKEKVIIETEEISLLAERLMIKGREVNPDLLTPDAKVIQPGPSFDNTVLNGVPLKLVIGEPAPESLQSSVTMQELFASSNILIEPTMPQKRDNSLDNMLKVVVK
jgi:hypothetical protein